MILYLDSSALVKLFVSEPASEAARAMAGAAAVLATSRVSYAEASSAFARRHRERRLTEEALRTLVDRLNAAWSDMALVDVDEIAAGALAVRHGLRGFDAIHLAAACVLHAAAAPEGLRFLSYDERQNVAAGHEGLRLATPD